MRVLISVGSYAYLTGSELYCYGLACELRARGHDVAITAGRVGNEIAQRSRDSGIAVFSFTECPSTWAPDILHVNQLLPACFALATFPHVPAVATIHSEFDNERPLVTDSIRKYICVRESIRALASDRYGIMSDRTVVIPNGIDAARFASVRTEDDAGTDLVKRVLFVGTVDGLRRESLMHLIAKAGDDGWRVRVVGDKHAGYLDRPPPHVEMYPATWEIERHLADATATAGVLLGRTTIEGWFAGLPGWIYDIGPEGSIKSVELFAPPPDLARYDIANVASRVLVQYEDALAAGAPSNAEQMQALGLITAVGFARISEVEAQVGEVRGQAETMYRRYATVARLAKRVMRRRS
jgi:glycosyltransferase involved in cell wall biosynthesis